jgi:hypothetical protein
MFGKRGSIMKRKSTYFILFMVLSMVYYGDTYTCPTCVGKITLQSEPFFTKNFYKSEKTQKNTESSSTTHTTNTENAPQEAHATSKQ